MCKQCAISYGKTVLEVYNETVDDDWAKPTHCKYGHRYTPGERDHSATWE